MFSVYSFAALLAVLQVYHAPVMRSGYGPMQPVAPQRESVLAGRAHQGGAPSRPRTVEFAGLTWEVKTGHGGPGPNYWSDSQSSVWVDGSGLHLKIRKVGSTWYCAEVNTVLPTRYGMHRFYVDSRLDSLDRNVVFSPFLYKDDNTEVDIEVSRWGWNNPYNLWYVVQPSVPGNKDSAQMSLTGTYSTHYIDWSEYSILFRSFHGHYEEPPPGYLINEWLYYGDDIPEESEGLRIHINQYDYAVNSS